MRFAQFTRSLSETSLGMQTPISVHTRGLTSLYLNCTLTDFCGRLRNVYVILKGEIAARVVCKHKVMLRSLKWPFKFSKYDSQLYSHILQYSMDFTSGIPYRISVLFCFHWKITMEMEVAQNLSFLTFEENQLVKIPSETTLRHFNTLKNRRIQFF